jgi:hypothetical protein
MGREIAICINLLSLILYQSNSSDDVIHLVKINTPSISKFSEKWEISSFLKKNHSIFSWNVFLLLPGLQN